MPNDYIELPFPLGGESDDMGKAHQAPYTVRGSVNMRAKDSLTGEKRGAQRAGWTPYVTGGGSKVDWLGQQGFQVPLITYTQLATPVLDKNILTPPKAEAFSAATDRNGDVYVLDANDTIRIYNSELREIGHITLPLTETDTVARTIVVDDRDNVYVGARFPRGDIGGRVWCYRKSDERWTQSWELPVIGGVVDLTYRFGTLFVAQIILTDGFQSAVSAYDVTPGAPVQLWQRAVAYPVRGIAVDPGGDVIVTSPPNAERNLSPDEAAFQTPQIGWTPYDLANSEERIHFWADAELLTGKSSFDPITHWDDTRDAGVWNIDFTTALDKTDRFLFRRRDQVLPQGGDILDSLREREEAKFWLNSPRYDPKAFGTKPGLRFTGDEEKEVKEGLFGNVLSTLSNRASENKQFDATGSLPDNRSLVPGVEGARWAIVFLARVTVRDGRSVLIAHGGQFNFQLVVNAGSTVNQVTDTPGSITLRSTSTNIAAGDLTTAAFNWETNNPSQTVLVVIAHNGVGNAMTFRVNGNDVEVTVQWTEDRCFDSAGGQATGLIGATTRTGVRKPNDPPDYAPEDLSLVASALADPFYGSVAEIITVFGDTTTTPHDTSVTAAEIEFLEGYFAWKWGVAANLPGAHAYDTAPPAAIGFSGATFTSEEQSVLLSVDGITAKYRASSGGFVWAFDGFGMGLAVAADEDGGVFTYGPGDPDVLAADASPAMRKVLDEGTRVEQGDRATATLTFVNLPLDADTIVIGTKTYTFRTVLGTSQFEVQIGASIEETRNNFIDAINLTGIPGTTYPTQHITAHHQVSAVRTLDGSPPPVFTTDQMTVLSIIRGSTENSVITTSPTPRMTWDTSTLTGGDALGTWTLAVPRDLQSPDPNTELSAISGAGAWKVQADDNDDVYVTRTRLGVVGASGLYKYAGQGNADGTPIELWNYTTAYVSQFVAEHYTSFAFEPFHPVYDPDTITGPENIYLTTEGPEGEGNLTTTFSTKNLHKLNLVSNARSGATNPRGVRNLRVAGGNLERFTKAGVYVSVIGGTGVFDATPREVVAAELYGERFFSDGIKRSVYNAKKDEVIDWIAEKGEVPKRITLLASWRGRIVAVSADDPFNYIMSRIGDGLDWDEFPDVVTFEQPISGNNPASLGKIPDVITGMIPINDQNLAFMCDHTIHMMTGDPLAIALSGFAKSYIQLVSDITGMAKGSPAWCKDPNGVVYFLGSRGGLYRWAPGSMPQEISGTRIRRQLESIDFTLYRIGLAWNYRERSVYIFQMPWGAGGTIVRHWCWESDTGRWPDGVVGSFWPDEMSLASRQPTALAVFDGDLPDDRDMLIGCEDGTLRFWDDLAVNDDGAAIVSVMPCGPYVLGRAGYDTAITNTLIVLGENADAARVELFASQEPVRPVQSFAERELAPGRNGAFLQRAVGRFMWISFENGSAAERWSHETTTLRLAEMGLSRVRGGA